MSEAVVVSILTAWLDPGEAAVITLAGELGISRVLIDERRGRVAARRAGLVVGGSVGVLLAAKRAGLVAAVRPAIEAMRSKGVWLGEALVVQALRQAGEA